MAYEGIYKYIKSPDGIITLKGSQAGDPPSYDVPPPQPSQQPRHRRTW